MPDPRSPKQVFSRSCHLSDSDKVIEVNRIIRNKNVRSSGLCDTFLVSSNEIYALTHDLIYGWFSYLNHRFG